MFYECDRKFSGVICVDTDQYFHDSHAVQNPKGFEVNVTCGYARIEEKYRGLSKNSVTDIV